MSIENNQVEPNKDESNTQETIEQESNSVSSDLYKKTSVDMMKFKQERNSLRQELEALKAEREAASIAKLEADGEKDKVADYYKSKYQEVENERAQERESVVNLIKRNAVTQGVGGFVKPTYAEMAINLDNILMVDGALDEDSVNAEVERIRREDSQLLKVQSGASLPNGAPDVDVNDNTNDFSNMTSSQKMEWRRNLIKNKNK